LSAQLAWGAPDGNHYDLVIYGATVAGIMAAVQGARMGKSVVLIQTGNHFGGLTTGGLSNTDKGDESTIGGLARKFYEDLGTHYGEEVSWKFEPSVAERYLRKALAPATASGKLKLAPNQKIALTTPRLSGRFLGPKAAENTLRPWPPQVQSVYRQDRA